MSASVAEYLGKRTDIDNINIQPERDYNAKCPFTSEMPCRKLSSSKHYHPICSVRNERGEYWITCPDRLCSTERKYSLCQYQRDILLQIGKTIFDPSVGYKDICVKREVPVPKPDGRTYHADYVMTLSTGRSPFSGPDRLIVEMQGGGETTNTGHISQHVNDWCSLPKEKRTNKFLRETISAAGTLQTNAWRRQQEQFLVKGNTAMNSWKGYGIAFCVGTLLYDYLMDKFRDVKLPDLRENNWTLAIITFKEDTSQPKKDGPVPLIIDQDRLLFTNYQTFVHALINQGIPEVSIFTGHFINLLNEPVDIPNP